MWGVAVWGVAGVVGVVSIVDNSSCEDIFIFVLLLFWRDCCCCCCFFRIMSYKFPYLGCGRREDFLRAERDGFSILINI